MIHLYRCLFFPVFIIHWFQSLCNYSHHISKGKILLPLNLLHKLMFSPSVSETETLKGYNFCDDVGEQYHRGIVQDIRNIELVKEILPFKLFCIDSADGLYWYYGTLAASSAPCKSLWKYGYYLTRRLISLIRQG